MALFEKGRAKTGGRKRGSRNKSVYKFRDRLEAQGVDFEGALAEAIKTKDVELIKALQSLLPYLQPKLKEREAPAEEPESTPEEEASTEELLSLLK
jgi:hypothetical protein